MALSSPHVPPPNYAHVADGLHRSGFPNELNFLFLERLRVKTIVFLRGEVPDRFFLDWINDQGIDLVLLDPFPAAPRQAIIHRTKHATISEETVLAALDVILDSSRYPVLVMCNSGRGKTGIVIGCLRKVMRWNVTSIFEEYRRYAGSKLRLLNEQFIELFDCDLVRVLQNHPAWL